MHISDKILKLDYNYSLLICNKCKFEHIIKETASKLKVNYNVLVLYITMTCNRFNLKSCALGIKYYNVLCTYKPK